MQVLGLILMMVSFEALSQYGQGRSYCVNRAMDSTYSGGAGLYNRNDARALCRGNRNSDLPVQCFRTAKASSYNGGLGIYDKYKVIELCAGANDLSIISCINLAKTSSYNGGAGIYNTDQAVELCKFGNGNAPVECFRIAQESSYNGGLSMYSDNDAAKLCKGSRRPRGRINCYKVARDSTWQGGLGLSKREAIEHCSNRGSQNGNHGPGYGGGHEPGHGGGNGGGNGNGNVFFGCEIPRKVARAAEPHQINRRGKLKHGEEVRVVTDEEMESNSKCEKSGSITTTHKKIKVYSCTNGQLTSKNRKGEKVDSVENSCVNYERCSEQEYFRQRPDVMNAYKRKKYSAKRHFDNHGKNENMCMPTTFETCTVAQYYEKRPDVRNAGVKATTHYRNHGRWEGMCKPQ